MHDRTYSTFSRDNGQSIKIRLHVMDGIKENPTLVENKS